MEILIKLEEPVKAGKKPWFLKSWREGFPIWTDIAANALALKGKAVARLCVNEITGGYKSYPCIGLCDDGSIVEPIEALPQASVEKPIMEQVPVKRWQSVEDIKKAIQNHKDTAPNTPRETAFREVSMAHALKQSQLEDEAIARGEYESTPARDTLLNYLGAAITQLELYLDTLKARQQSALREEKHEDHDHAEKKAGEVRQAIKVLQAALDGPIY